MGKYYWGTGRRKTSVARVRIKAGSGNIEVNDEKYDEYFQTKKQKDLVMQPLNLLNMQDRYDIFVNVNGGGLNGQAGAIRHGLSRALVEMDESLRNELKQAGFLKRDDRMKERRKYGRKKARKRKQTSKR
ncbi:MAG: 30S ribosomal protein S9 [Candidatus Mcinerneyibacterium aminivorans]|uniref:Small ribosomal subunit protein uS9 n=1 Tax=Candidatus Mcinerneyibacterium aminivorans TaxID=2703815 RepID=A0A5D0ME43_9BACT|nr:MAG: 30S ribosomal protein S9 [Candidatus Mcinerneyibacterium aminivorans]